MNVKRILVSLAAVAAVVAIPVAVRAGFAPANRPTYTCITPTNCPGADHVVFNSFTNAPNYGDERAFFDAKDASITTPGGYQDQLNVHDGQRIVMRVYVHNNANPNAIGVAAATAHNTRLLAFLPTSKRTSHTAAAQISADNANPGTVSDTVDLSGAQPFTIVFDKTSAPEVTYRPNGTGNFVTRPLPGATFANDQTLNANMGDWKGCFEFGALITFVAVVHMDQAPQPMFACTGLDVLPVNRTRFDFTAHGSAKNATIAAYVFTAKDANGNVVDTKTVSTSATSANYTFNRDVPGTYTISAVVHTDKGDTNPADCSKQITVKEKPPKPVFACDALTVSRGDGRAITATVSFTAEGGASLSSITYDFGDGTTPLVTSQNPVGHTYDRDGTFTITSMLKFNVGGTDKTASCSATVTITTPPTPTPPTPTPPAVLGKPLPNTGAGDVIGLFSGVSAAGAAAHYIVSARRSRR